MSGEPVERDIIARIDALVDTQLQNERSGYDHNINQDACTLCFGEWHGLPSMGCPGAFATEKEAAVWREKSTQTCDLSLIEQTLQSIFDLIANLLGIGNLFEDLKESITEEDLAALPEPQRTEFREMLRRATA